MSHDQQPLALRLAEQLGESGFEALQLAASELRRLHEVEAGRAQPWEKCKHHGTAHQNEWACPTCLRELRKERDALRKDAERMAYLCRTNGWDERDIAEIDAARSET